MKIKAELLLFNLVILVSSCASYRGVEIKKVQNVRFHIIEQPPSASFELIIKNPNTTGLRLRHAHADFFFAEKFLCKAELKKSIKIPAESEIAIPFDAHFDARNLPEFLPAGLGLLFGNTKARIRITGDIRVRKFLWYSKFIFNLEQDIDRDILKSLNFN